MIGSLVVLIFGSCFFGACAAGDFGLPYNVPGFESSFRNTIGTGIVAIVKANATLAKYDVALDRSGTTGVLYGVANNLTSPLNKLLGHVAASFGVNGTDSRKALFEELQATVAPTTAALKLAAGRVRSLEGAVRSNLITTLTANLSTIETEVGTLGRNWIPFAEALQTTDSPESTYSAKNISSLITPNMVQSLTTPVQLINAALRDISDVFGTVAKDRTAAIGHETATNASVQNAYLDLTGSVAIVARTLSEAARQMEQQSNGTVRQVRDSYATLLGRLEDTSQVTRVNGFLEMLETQGQSHNRRMNELLGELAANYTRAVEVAKDAIGDRLSAATAAMVDEATISESSYADRCLQRYVADFRQMSYAPTRLSSCYQVDARTVTYFSTANTAFLEQLRYGAVYANQALSVCQSQSSANCTAVYLDPLESVAERNQLRLGLFIGFLREEMATLTERYGVCMRAIQADIGQLVEATNQKFRNCFQTGK
ncbi:uncharacterized protein LOC128723739 [Anopheles nili]|uniref:uncharacterized protein LOC128723739 n=1 Tax=Anopheles nili TaxID=185578 RepID=UPI00237ADDB5|nr:uncharacterized protein LOC128723739 [Anopheles nili]